MAFEIGAIEIGIAVGGYLLKSWWDRQNIIRDRREALYARYMDVVYLWNDVAHGFGHREKSIAEVLNDHDELFSELLVYASDDVLKASVEFVKAANVVQIAGADDSDKVAALLLVQDAYAQIANTIRAEVGANSFGAMQKKSKLHLQKLWAARQSNENLK
jgi:hypothetical protein